MEKRDLISGLLILLFAYFLIDNLKYDERPIIEVENGFLRGVISYTDDYTGKYKSFLGIPFAKPPVNELRFEPPEPPQNWTGGIRDAGYYRPPCIQADILFTGWVYGNENCLHLSVFVPMPMTQPKAPFPVLVFIHGGCYHFGSSQDHGEQRFMNDQDVILVTLNYRLGALGFLSTGDGIIRGNQGLSDQRMALKWIQQNIKHFNGDPKHVTIFGESVGGTSVGLHILSKASKGLFHRAISQSGTPLNYFAINPFPKTQAQEFAKKLSCPTNNSTEMASCLKSLDVIKLVSVHRQALDLFSRDRNSMFAATVEVINDDKAFLVEEPLKILERGDFTKIPIILGVNSGEGLISSSAIIVNQTKQDIVLKDWETGLPAYLWYKRNDKVSERIRNYYFGSSSMSKKQLEENLTSVLSDRAFNHPVSKAAKLYSKHTETYLYYFNYKPYLSLQPLFTDAESYYFHPSLRILINFVWRWVKEFVLRQNETSNDPSCHGDELPLLFNLPWGPYMMSTLPSRDAKISRHLIRTFTAFAKSWDHLIFDKVEWKPVNSTSGPLRYLEISTKSKMINEPFSEQVEFWDLIENSLLEQDPNV